LDQCKKKTYIDAKGNNKRYNLSDVAYDVNAGRIKIVHPLLVASPEVMHVNSKSSSSAYESRTWLNDLKSNTDAPPSYRPNATFVNSMFDEKAQLFLLTLSDAAPLNDDPGHAVEIEWQNGETEDYLFMPNSSPHACIHKCVLSPGEKPPRSLREVHRLSGPARNKYLKALEKEYTGLWNRGMFRLVKRSSLPPGTPVFPTTTVFRMKFFQDGTPDRAKARVCLRGDLMIPGRDYSDVRSPTTQNNSVKMMLADCPVSGKIACTFDIEQAFTYGKTDPLKPQYIDQFPGTEKILDSDTGEQMVQKLMYRLYGDPAAPKAFHAELHQAFMDYSYLDCKFVRSRADPCVYVMHCPDESNLSSCIFVDDSCNTFKPETDAQYAYIDFIKFIKTRFKLKDDSDGLDLISSFLGMNITWADDRSWIRIDQPLAIAKLVEGSGVDISIPKFTPLPPSTEIQLTDCPVLTTEEGRKEAELMKKLDYRSRIGELLWLSRVSRPDISVAVCKLSTVTINPGLVHWDLSSHLIQYVYHTRHLGIVYKRGESDYPYGFADVAFSPNYGNVVDNYRSFEGYLMKMAGGPISWGAKFQKLLALSSTEAEYYGLTTAAKVAIHLTSLCEDLGIHSDEPFLIYEDNKAAMKMADNSFDTKRTAHLDRRAHYIREQVNNGNIQLDYCPTKLMEADALTKILSCAPRVAHHLSG